MFIFRIPLKVSSSLTPKLVQKVLKRIKELHQFQVSNSSTPQANILLAKKSLKTQGYKLSDFARYFIDKFFFFLKT
jgi:hypothetical protein